MILPSIVIAVATVGGITKPARDQLRHGSTLCGAGHGPASGGPGALAGHRGWRIRAASPRPGVLTGALRPELARAGQGAHPGSPGTHPKQVEGEMPI